MIKKWDPTAGYSPKVQTHFPHNLPHRHTSFLNGWFRHQTYFSGMLQVGWPLSCSPGHQGQRSCQHPKMGSQLEGISPSGCWGHAWRGHVWGLEKKTFRTEPKGGREGSPGLLSLLLCPWLETDWTWNLWEMLMVGQSGHAPRNGLIAFVWVECVCSQQWTEWFAQME